MASVTYFMGGLLPSVSKQEGNVLDFGQVNDRGIALLGPDL